MAADGLVAAASGTVAVTLDMEVVAARSMGLGQAAGAGMEVHDYRKDVGCHGTVADWVLQTNKWRGSSRLNAGVGEGVVG